MKIRTTGAAIIFALAFGGAAVAETKADTFGLGDHEAVPEKTAKIDKDLSVRVRLILEKAGTLAAKVKKGEIIRVEVAYFSRDGAKDRLVSLVCSAQFIDTKAEKSESSVSGKPCFEGRLEDAYGRFRELDMNLRFRAEATDPAGTYGVVVKVLDSVSGKQAVLVPTYTWLDGAK
jgi:hypothetical protein